MIAFLFGCLVGCLADVSPSQSLIWGPGLTRAVTPARHFFVTLVDHQGRNMTESPGEGLTGKVTVIDKSGRARVLRLELADLADGNFQGWYILGIDVKQVSIDVQWKGAAIGRSPVILKGGHFLEGCHCPKPTSAFLLEYGCEASDPAGQIAADFDLSSIGGRFTREHLEQAFSTLQHQGSCFVHYAVKDNVIYGKAHGKYQGFKKYMDDMLLSLSQKVRLPNVEFFMQLGDWPQIFAVNNTHPLPVFSWCGSEDTLDAVLPTYKMVLATVFGKDLENVQEVDRKAAAAKPWSSKIEKLHFRGRPSNARRTELAALTKQHPDVLDVRITANHFNYFPDDAAKREHQQYEKQHGKKAQRMKFEEFFQHKYLASLDGTVAAYRLPAILAGTSLVFKQDSLYYEHFYGGLHEGEHFVSLKEDLSDVLEQIEWARSHDEEARGMAQAARDFTRRHLRPTDVYCYHYLALAEVAKLEDFEPQVDGLDPVERVGKQCACPSVRRKKKRKGK